MQNKRAYIDFERCPNCEKCPAAAECPTKSLTREEAGDPLFVDIQCIGCGKCVRQCVHNAIRLI
ncbi:MAG: ATP-binding protein [Bacillota bacterium]